MFELVQSILPFKLRKNKTFLISTAMIGVFVLIMGMLLMYKGANGGIGFVFVFFGWFLTIVYYLIIWLIIDSSIDETLDSDSVYDIKNIMSKPGKYKLSKNEMKILNKVVRKIDENNY